VKKAISAIKVKFIRNDSSFDEATEIDLPGDIFGLKPRSDILSRVVTWQLAKRRAGTHKTKTRSEVSGSTRKIYRQKGSGKARHGAIRGAQFRGGGIIFGPVVRSHEYNLQKKVRALGLKMALSAKAQAGELIVLENFRLQEGKTKEALKRLSFLENTKALLIDGELADSTMKRAIANLHLFHILPTIGANVYDILKRDKLLLSLEAIETLTRRFTRSPDVYEEEEIEEVVNL
jgi:large subunit ribosomal protein L4